ncbi:hypothetical protein GCM10027417_27110 [Glutamicibacter endophyticus]
MGAGDDPARVSLMYGRLIDKSRETKISVLPMGRRHDHREFGELAAALGTGPEANYIRQRES